MKNDDRSPFSFFKIGEFSVGFKIVVHRLIRHSLKDKDRYFRFHTHVLFKNAVLQIYRGNVGLGSSVLGYFSLSFYLLFLLNVEVKRSCKQFTSILLITLKNVVTYQQSAVKW